MLLEKGSFDAAVTPVAMHIVLPPSYPADAAVVAMKNLFLWVVVDQVAFWAEIPGHFAITIFALLAYFPHSLAKQTQHPLHFEPIHGMAIVVFFGPFVVAKSAGVPSGATLGQNLAVGPVMVAPVHLKLLSR